MAKSNNKNRFFAADFRYITPAHHKVNEIGSILLNERGSRHGNGTRIHRNTHIDVVRNTLRFIGLMIYVSPK